VLSGGQRSIHISHGRELSVSEEQSNSDGLSYELPRAVRGHVLCGPKSQEVRASHTSAALIEELEEYGGVEYCGGFVCDYDVDKTVAHENQALTCSSTGTALYNLHPEVKKIDPIPLLSSCGQIHAEGESVLYGGNVFCIESLQDLRRFLGGRTIHQLEQIRAISLFITADLESYFSALERTMNPTWQCALIPVPYMKWLETLNVSIEHVYFGKSIDLENLGLNGWTPVPCYIRNLLGNSDCVL
jgi:hypothetical protein